MSEEFKKEMQDAELKLEDLAEVAGGYTEYDKGWAFQTRFIFDEAEVRIIKEVMNITLEAGRDYTRSELNKLGIEGRSAKEIGYFLGSIGVHKS